MGDPKNHSSWRWELAAAAIALTGVLVRCSRWGFIFVGDQVIVPSVDSSYHLWRAGMLAREFPALSLFDPFISFPVGAPIPWPPGFDLLLALPALLTGNGNLIPAWSAILMPLLGGLAVYLVYRFARRLFDLPTGLLAAGLLATMDGAVGLSAVGRVDHHALVAPLTLAMFLAFVKALDADTTRGRLGSGLLCGVLAAACVGSFSGTPPVFFLPIPLTIVIVGLMGRAESIRTAALAVLVSSLVLVLVVVVLCGDLSAHPFSLYSPSWLAVCLFGLAAGVAGLATWRPGWALVAGILVVVAAGVVLLVAPQWLPVLDQAVSVASAQDTGYLLAAESTPLFSESAGHFTVSRAVMQYTYLILLVPVLWGLYAAWLVRRRTGDPAQVLCAILTLMGAGLLLVQRRFGEFAVPYLAILYAFGMVGLARILGRLSGQPGKRRRAWILGTVLAVALMIALSPLPRGVLRRMSQDRLDYQRALMNFAGKLAGIIRPPACGAAGPEYGLLAAWGDSHHLLLALGVPVVVSSFGTREAQEADRMGFRILLAAGGPESYQRLREMRVRYLVLSPVITQLEAMARMAGLHQRFVEVEPYFQGDRAMVSYRPLSPFRQSLHTRLYLADGLGSGAQSLRHYRLILESENLAELLGQRVSLHKAFEVVAGAHLRGLAGPGQRVRLRLSLVSNTGRSFLYQDETMADSNGQFELVVPYSTSPGGRPVRAVGLYRIKIGDVVHRVEVTEEQVLGGKVVEW